MKNVKVKICGVRNVECAEAAVSEGADFLGFNFIPASKRYIEPRRAKKIIERIRKRVQVVGIFKNHAVSDINEIAQLLQLDYAQVHGAFLPSAMKHIQIKTIKVISAGGNAKDITLDTATYLLLDRAVQGQGAMVDMDLAFSVARNFPVFLAGGLTIATVSGAVEKVRPYGVDVAGGVETNGKQDPGKIREFIKRAKETTV